MLFFCTETTLIKKHKQFKADDTACQYLLLPMLGMYTPPSSEGQHSGKYILDTNSAGLLLREVYPSNNRQVCEKTGDVTLCNLE